MPVPAVVAAAVRNRTAAVKRAVAARAVARLKRDEDRGSRKRRVLVWAVGLFLLAFGLPMMMIIVAIGGTRDPHRGVSAAALSDIPAEALNAYLDAAERWQVDWAVLAAIGKVECDHGRTQAAGCNPPGSVNPAGARGYMQFLGGTWRRGLGQRELEPRTSPPAADGRGYATDGDGDGDADPWSWPDATHSSARYLVHLGVREDPERAVFGYNHSQSYVTEVLSIATTYRAAGGADGTSQGFAGSPGNVPLTTVEGITVHAQIATQVQALVQAARADGFELSGGGYRSPSEQIELRRQNCGTSHYAIYEMPSSRCSPPTARPGSSNHELGLAIDFSCNGSLLRSRSSACFQWMQAHAPAYGLHNLPSEPWHFSVDGR